jgi:Zn-dependent oligopeptidase
MTLNEKIYNAVLMYSSNQQIRKLLFDKYNSRASFNSDTMHNNNSESMKNIINYRYEL